MCARYGVQSYKQKTWLQYINAEAITTLSTVVSLFQKKKIVYRSRVYLKVSISPDWNCPQWVKWVSLGKWKKEVWCVVSHISSSLFIPILLFYYPFSRGHTFPSLQKADCLQKALYLSLGKVTKQQSAATNPISSAASFSQLQRPARVTLRAEEDRWVAVAAVLMGSGEVLAARGQCCQQVMELKAQPSWKTPAWTPPRASRRHPSNHFFVCFQDVQSGLTHVLRRRGGGGGGWARRNLHLHYKPQMTSHF